MLGNPAQPAMWPVPRQTAPAFGPPPSDAGAASLAAASGARALWRLLRTYATVWLARSVCYLAFSATCVAIVLCIAQMVVWALIAAYANIPPYVPVE